MKQKVEPCVNHSEKLHITQIRLSQYFICKEKLYIAALWSLFEFTHNLRLAKYTEAKENNLPLPTLWQWQTTADIISRAPIKEGNIRYALDFLSKLGIIELWNYGYKGSVDPSDKRFGKIKRGIDPEGKISERRWILFHPEMAQRLIDEWENTKDNQGKYFVYKNDSSRNHSGARNNTIELEDGNYF
ncbi:MAG TPA: hypothetical protein PLP33_24605 [Leptospiraceae bacterium]|nr:hypothetical protein [Leptospiraceae bacterium]